MRAPVLLALSLALLVVPPRAAAAQAASSDGINAAYQRLYAGDVDGASRTFETLRATDRRHLPFWFGQLLAEFARLQADESLAPGLERGIDEFIVTSDARYARSRADTEALFYLGHALMLRAAYRLSEDKGIWGAARDAARAKGLVDQYIRQHPGHGDAYLTLGIYNYFVGIAPTFVKVLRVLLLLPGGNRTDGLAQISRAAHDGRMFAPLAQGLLGTIYGWLEGRMPEAITIGQQLADQFPGNAFVRISLAQLYAHPTVEAYDRAAKEYQAVIGHAASSSLQHVSERHAATLGLAGLRRIQWRVDDAIALLNPALDQQVEKPAWIRPTFLLQRANFRMLLNDPSAPEDVRRVLGDPKMAKWHKEARRDARTIEEWFRPPNDAAVYASLIPGNRLVGEDRWAEAQAFYQRSAATGPGDWQVRYRLAVLDFSRRDYAAAAAAFESIVSAGGRMPDWLKGSALLHLAWTRDVAGRRDEALTLYRRILSDFADESPAAAARLGLLAPYKGPIKGG